jgi:hypothetical protein
MIKVVSAVGNRKLQDSVGAHLCVQQRNRGPEGLHICFPLGIVAKLLLAVGLIPERRINDSLIPVNIGSHSRDRERTFEERLYGIEV